MEKVMILLFHSAAKQISSALRCVDSTLEAIFLTILIYLFQLMARFPRLIAKLIIRDSDRATVARNSIENAIPIAASGEQVEAKMSVSEVRDAMVKLWCGEESFEDELFEEGEVGSEEVRKAFEVFDENKDGFIDAEEVQRVLGALGVMEASDIQCNGMIRAFDNDGDGKINFSEFTKIIEDSFL